MSAYYDPGIFGAAARFGARLARRVKRAWSSPTQAASDAKRLIALGAVVMLVEYYYDLAPKMFLFALAYEGWEVDNLIFMIFLMSLGLLFFSVRRARELSGEIEARRSAELKATSLARHDPLTGLPNRRHFIETLNDALLLATEEAPTAVLMLDLDGFKLINDAYGHAVGDQCLIEFAKRVSAVMRGGAMLSRLGGDEFAVIFPDAGSAVGPAALARSIVAEVAEPFQIGQISASLGVCVGMAVAPADATAPDLLVQRADRALYRAKAEGRSKICFFEPDLDAHVERRTALELALRAAIAAHEIVPFYQPIVCLKTNQVVGLEALARWRNASGEWIGPDLFIPLAEDLGLIGELGDQLLRRACLDARVWPSNLTLAFNVSAKQLCDPTLGLRILAILGETGFSPRRLEVEITETAAVDNIKVVQNVTGQLRQAGVRIALDDFGTGYSTFAQLLSLKPDKIKIDRSFVDRLGEDKDRTMIVRALLGLASGFELATTAEGIENQAQFSALIADGCLEGQGYLFGKAAPAEQVPGLLDRGGGAQSSVA